LSHCIIKSFYIICEANILGYGFVSFGRKNCRVDLPEICVTSGHIDSGTGWNAAGADGDTTNGGVGTASFVPKTNSSIALPSCLRFSVLMSTLS
jgi:hypothetical protein